jgi:hypothetical protein
MLYSDVTQNSLYTADNKIGNCETVEIHQKIGEVCI